MKITKLLLLSLAVIFFACSEDDEKPLPTSEGMVGEWLITGLEYKGSTTTSGQGLSVQADFTGKAIEMDMTSTFGANPNTVTSAGSYTIELTTTSMGQTVTEEVTLDEVVSDGTWSLSGRELTVTNDFTSQTATVVEQTSTTLKLKIDVNETQTSQGFTVATKVQATYTFKKK